jgi:hypothetical protein
VGVNLGDVVVNKDDLLGDGVNVAARLESMAEPGGICIASSVYDQITGKLDLGFQDIGQQNLKNISRPIHVYRVSGAVPPIAAMQPALQPVLSPIAPPATGRSPMLWIVAGFALLLIALAVGWQSGWIRVGAPQPLPTLVAAPAAVPVAVASSAAPVVPEIPPAPLPKPSTRVVAAAVAKASVPPEPRRAPAQTPPPASVAQVAPAPTQAHVPVAARPATIEPLVSASGGNGPALAPAGVSRFDGRWRVLVECTRHDGGALGYRVDLFADVKDGWLRGEFGTPGNPGWLLMEGAIRADGNALLIAKGLTGDPRYNVRSEATGTPYGYQVRARFDAQSGSGVRMQVRPCGVTFARQ